MGDWSEDIKFKEFTDFLEKLVKTPKKSRFKNLDKFLNSCRNRIQNKSDGKKKQSLFPIIRFLLPGLDKERGSYNMKESVLGDLYIRFLQLGKTSEDAKKLKNFKAPKFVQDDAGDFASVVFTVMSDRSYPSSGASCAQVNSWLDEIVRLKETEGRGAVEQVLKTMFLKMSSVEQKWMIRIVLKEVKISMGHNKILAAVHRDAKELFEVNSNLREVCEKLHDPTSSMHEIEIQIFHPFKPQLADRIPVAKIESAMKGKAWYSEIKFDGERMQAHMKDGDFKFFSRNGNDFTAEFGGSSSDPGKFSNYLAKSMDLNKVKSVILDGEICAWDKINNELLQKSEKMDIRNIKADSYKYQQCVIIYDICFLNGKTLTGLPLKERIAQYESIIKPIPGRVQLSKRKLIHTKDQVVEELHKAIDDKEEGLVLKDPDGIYKPNARTGSGWIKLKPDYENSLMDQVDLVILGGYFGTGRHSGNVAHFLVGLKDDTEPEGKFLSFCRVSNGFTASELEEVLKKCGKTLKKIPDYVSVSKDKPDVWFDPKVAPVLQVNAAEIVYSSAYSAGCALRFPRVEQVRADKDWSSATSLQEIETIRMKGGGKLFGNKRYSSSDNDTPVAKKQRAASQPGSSGGGARLNLRPIYTHKDMTNERIETFNLKERVVVVEPCQDLALKRNLERIVVKHGGTVEQNTKAGHTSIYIQTAGTIKAKNVINQGLIDVVKSSWLLGCDTEFHDYGPLDCVFATEKSKNGWRGMYDETGDSYTQPANLQSLKASLEHSRRCGEVSEEDKEDLISDLAAYKYFLFKGLRFDLQYPDDEKEKLDIDSIIIKNYGGQICDSSTAEKISHIVCSNPDDNVVDKLRSRRENLIKSGISMFQAVSPDWISECIDNNRIVNTSPFSIL